MADKSERETEILKQAEIVRAAGQAAIREALLDHKRAGNPVAQWRDGRVVWIQAEDILLEDEPPKA